MIGLGLGSGLRWGLITLIIYTYKIIDHSPISDLYSDVQQSRLLLGATSVYGLVLVWLLSGCIVARTDT